VLYAAHRERWRAACEVLAHAPWQVLSVWARYVAKLRSRAALRVEVRARPWRRLAAELRSRAASRVGVLARIATKPRPMHRDVGYDAETDVWSFRAADGRISHTHPAGAPGEIVRGLSADGHYTAPRWPPSSTNVVLMPEASGTWCYYDINLGEATWDPPTGSTPLSTRTLTALARPFDGPPPELPRVTRGGEICYNSLDRDGLTIVGTDWVPLFRDSENRIQVYNKLTGCVRNGPWICLRPPKQNGVYFANLVTKRTRWLPPPGWFEDWVSRPGANFTGLRYPVEHPLARWVLPIPDARHRVEGGAPYLGMWGRPQYESDELDTPHTYPLHPPLALVAVC
jgi:hypothetical protein